LLGKYLLIQTSIEEWKRATHEFPKCGKRNIRNHINRFGYRRKETNGSFALGTREAREIISTEKDSGQFVRILRSPRTSTGKNDGRKAIFFFYLVLWHTNKCCIDLFDTANLLELTLIEIWWLKFQRKSRAKIAYLFSLHCDFSRVCH